MEKWTKLYCSDYYEVSDMGNVRSVERVVPHKRYGQMRVKGKPLKICTDGRGYSIIQISELDKSSTIRIHTAVFNSFNKTKPNGCRYNVIDHIDGDISNNRLENLQRITQSENVLKGDRHR
jgi:hypothetical protein